jgi:hypothetical protein
MDEIINTEQTEQIIKAIIARKYSWACVLLLYFAGCQPQNYLPYRTYIRLLKDNYTVDNCQQNKLINLNH